MLEFFLAVDLYIGGIFKNPTNYVKGMIVINLTVFHLSRVRTVPLSRSFVPQRSVPIVLFNFSVPPPNMAIFLIAIAL